VACLTYQQGESSVNHHLVNAIILAKMALKDGVLDDNEQDFLQEMCDVLVKEPLEDVLEKARTEPLDGLLVHVESYPDRFFISMRAYMMAHADEHFDIQEEHFFDELITKLEITAEDLALIKRTGERLQLEDPGDPEPRLLELYNQSSFYRDDVPATL